MFCSKRKNISFETKIYDNQNFIYFFCNKIYISKKLNLDSSKIFFFFSRKKKKKNSSYFYQSFLNITLFLSRNLTRFIFRHSAKPPLNSIQFHPPTSLSNNFRNFHSPILARLRFYFPRVHIRGSSVSCRPITVEQYTAITRAKIEYNERKGTKLLFTWKT